jgi:hypothetical protein
MSTEHAADLLYGAKKIAAHLGMTQKQVYPRIYANLIPHFYVGHTLCSRRSTLDKWLADEEAAAMAKHPSCNHAQ